MNIADTISIEDFVQIDRLIVSDEQVHVLDYQFTIVLSDSVFNEFFITDAKLPESIKNEFLNLAYLKYLNTYIENINGEINGVKVRAPSQKFVVVSEADK